jgi:uncharacterized Zn finger protein (UPF0148 family)
MIHNGEDVCSNCGETVYFEFDDGKENEENREEEIFGVCNNCDNDYVISICYNLSGEVDYWTID